MTTNPVSLHDKALLAYISVSVWSARKLDKRATAKVTADAGATDDAARVNKHLLADSDATLRQLQKLGGKARRLLDENSLPWDDAGNRLLSNQKALTVVGELQEIIDEFDELADQFTQDYPVLRAQALAALGDLANDDDYPPPDVVRRKFAISLTLSPVPSGFSDLRVGMSPQQVDALKEMYEAKVKEQHGAALQAAWQRLAKDIEHLCERLTPDDEGQRKVFRDATVENLRDTCALLQTLNVFDDEKLETMRFRAEHRLAAIDAQHLRDNDTLAETVREEAEDILRKMQGFLNG